MALDTKTLNQAVSGYVSDVRNTMPIDRVYLFGSYAKGTASDDSDVDLCFFSDDFEDRPPFDVMSQLCRMTRKYRGVDIEPHAFPTSELQNDNPFVKEILRTGMEIKMNNERVYKMAIASVYPMYIQKAEKKGRSKEEVDAVTCWLTGYNGEGLQAQFDKGSDLETFFAEAPQINPKAHKITGVVCGVRVEDIEDPLMRKIRWLDKLVDELTKGKAIEKILRD